MKEIFTSLDRGLAKAIERVDQKTLDKLLGNFQWFNCQFGINNGLKTPQAHRWARKWLVNPDGETSFASYAPKSLEGFEIRTLGEEELSDEPALFAINYPSSPISGCWVCFALNWVIERRFGEGTGPYWFTTEFSSNPIFKTRTGSLLRRELSHIWAGPGETFIQPADFEARRRIIERAGDYLSSGGKLGISIESPGRKKMGRARIGAGRTISQLAQKTDFLIVPVGMWRERDDLNIRFGTGFRPRSLGDLEDYQKVADRIGVKIASLLPEEKRGVYGEVLRRLRL